MIRFIYKNLYFILAVLLIVILLINVGYYSGILIDVGREVYYPEQILQGQILYKDIFNIYGALAYQINAFLYLIFGAKLTTLYFSGGVCSFLIMSGIYFLAGEFMSKTQSYSLAVFAIPIGIISTSIFNYHFPYSYAVLYGLVSFIYSLYFLVRFDKTKNMDFLSISAFLGGMCVAFKYDFLLYSFVVLFFIIKHRSLKAFLYFISVPLISLLTLFWQDLRIDDILNTLNIYGAMAKSETLKYFYQNSGIYFHPKSLPTDCILFLMFCAVLSLVLFTENRKKIFIKIILIFVTFLAVLCWLSITKYYAFGFLPILVLVFTAINFKKLKTKHLIVAISAILVSVKVFWVLLLNSYGNYYAPILLLALFVVLFRVCPNKLVIKGSTILIYYIVFVFAIYLLFSPEKDYRKIETPKGFIYTNKQLAESTNELIDYFKTAPKGDVVVFPEGLIINFLTDRKSDNFYNSLLPLYAETFGEEKIVEHFEKTKPEYIVLNNLDMKDYYFRFICKDYAQKFCGFVQENYTHEKTIGDDVRYLVFKRK